MAAGVAREARHGELFRAVDHTPALAESRDRMLVALEEGRPEEAVDVAAADVGLTIAILRRANAASGPRRRSIATVAEAAETLGHEELEKLARETPVLGFFQRGALTESGPVAFALHALAVQRVAARLARHVGHERPDALLTAALLHDVGKLVLGQAPLESPFGRWQARTPEDRLAWERDTFGADHAVAGGELARRWAFPPSLAAAIARHHDHDATGDAALVRLSDLLAHYQHGRIVEPVVLHQAALAVGLGRDALGALMYELMSPIGPRDTAPAEPCPLTERELDVLRELATGKVYKQAASALGVSVSTVRNHAHNAYRKLRVADRTQAVMQASEHGWL